MKAKALTLSFGIWREQFFANPLETRNQNDTRVMNDKFAELAEGLAKPKGKESYAR
jgi:hypothetical protein